MRNVVPQRKPDHFDTRVRTPGREYLAELGRTPTTKEWSSHSYWRRILPDIHDLYGGICAYSCHWISYDTGADTVEHFISKNSQPNQAYEWENYRLVCATLNSRKKTHTDVLDPFVVQNGWFVLDFPSLQVKPFRNLGEPLRNQIWATINRLGLNDEGTCLKSRERFVKHFCTGIVSFDYLSLDAPFIASEITRQNLLPTLNDIMGYAFDAETIDD